jgi:hypothetical protein
MTIRAVASALGMSANGVHKMVRRGMPTTSVEEAVAWRKRNVNLKTKAPLEQAMRSVPVSIAPSSEDQEMAEEVAKLTEIPTRTKSCEDALRDAVTSRTLAKSMIVVSQGNGDYEAARRWMQTMQQLLHRQAALENQYRNLLERDGITIQVTEAEARYRGVLLDLKTIVSSMPAALAAKVNPQDPVLAQKALEEWRDKTLFKSIYEPVKQQAN